MFLRIRGQGACPENSQATLLHLRGFRHVPCPPPDGEYTLATLAQGEDGRHDTAAVEDSTEATTTTLRRFAFVHFGFGIQAPSIAEDQRRHVEQAHDSTVEEPRAPNALLPMLWKELWNVYDICYDGVALLPDPLDGVSEQLRTVAAAGAAGAAGGTAPELLAPQLPDGFTLPSARTRNTKAVVCSHYCSELAWPPEAFDRSRTAPACTGEAPTPALPRDTLLVVDLADLPAADGGSRIALALSWALGFASIQEDNPLLRACGFLVRLPLEKVPQSTGEALRAEPLYPTSALAAYEEARDFIGEHIQLVLVASHMGVALGSRAGTPTAPSTPAPCPPVMLVGRGEDELLQGVRALLKPVAVGQRRVVRLRTDEHLAECVDATEEEAAMLTAMAQAGRVPAVQQSVAPVRALIDGGEEPWDPCTLRERARLNFCPCCGSCGSEVEGAGGGHHGHSHGGGAH